MVQLARMMLVNGYWLMRQGVYLPCENSKQVENINIKNNNTSVWKLLLRKDNDTVLNMHVDLIRY